MNYISHFQLAFLKNQCFTSFLVYSYIGLIDKVAPLFFCIVNHCQLIIMEYTYVYVQFPSVISHLTHFPFIILPLHNDFK